MSAGALQHRKKPLKHHVWQRKRWPRQGKAKSSGSSSSASKAGLQFPVARLNRYLRKGKYASRVGVGAGVYMGAVLEYLCAEILELATRRSDNKKSGACAPHPARRPQRRGAQQALGSVTIASGGVLPTSTTLSPRSRRPKASRLLTRPLPRARQHHLTRFLQNHPRHPKQPRRHCRVGRRGRPGWFPPSPPAPPARASPPPSTRLGPPRAAAPPQRSGWQRRARSHRSARLPLPRWASSTTSSTSAGKSSRSRRARRRRSPAKKQAQGSRAAPRRARPRRARGGAAARPRRAAEAPLPS